MEHIDTLRKFIVDNFLFGEAGSLGDDTSFLQSGIIDSTGILEVFSFLEQTYHIELQDDELVPENLDSLRNLDAFVCRKLLQRDAGGKRATAAEAPPAAEETG